MVPSMEQVGATIDWRQRSRVASRSITAPAPISALAVDADHYRCSLSEHARAHHIQVPSSLRLRLALPPTEGKERALRSVEEKPLPGQSVTGHTCYQQSMRKNPIDAHGQYQRRAVSSLRPTRGQITNVAMNSQKEKSPSSSPPFCNAKQRNDLQSPFSSTAQVQQL